MILLIAVILGLAATLVRARLMHRTLIMPYLHWEWLVFVSVIPQLLVFHVPYTARLIPDNLIPVIQILTMAGLVIFALANLFKPGFWALCIGLFLNFIVIIANGGWMPIGMETLQELSPSQPENYWKAGSRLGFTKDRIMPGVDINLVWLSDRLTLPPGLPQNIAFSVGDVFISIGAIFLLWSLSREEKRRKDDTNTLVTDRSPTNIPADRRSAGIHES